VLLLRRLITYLLLLLAVFTVLSVLTMLTDEWCVKVNGRLVPSLLPSISDDRQDLLQKTFDRKLPWTDVETQYYDAVSSHCIITLFYSDTIVVGLEQ